MNPFLTPRRSGATTTLIALVAGLALTSCDSAATATPADAGSTSDVTSGGDTSSGGLAYTPFQQSNLEAQLVRVAGMQSITKLRKSADFKAENFGEGCTKWSATATSPSDATKIGSLYVESAGLAGKVAGRKDDHTYNAGAEVGAGLNTAICAAIDAGGKAGPVARNALGSIDWQAQIIDKALLHFAYLSVYHYMVDGSRKGYDEGVGYYGMTLDGAESLGLAATVKARDGNCGTTYSKDIWALLLDGKTKLAAALAAEGKTGNDEKLAALTTELQANAAAIDAQLLEVFAISMGREMVELQAGEDITIKLIEGRMFFHILQPHIAAYDKAKGTTYATQLAAALDQDDPTKAKPADVLAAIKAIWGLDVPTLCTK